MLCGKVCLRVVFIHVSKLCRRVRSWPFDTLIGAFCLTFRALSGAPISVANGRDLGPLSAALRCGVSDLALAAAPLLYVSKVVAALPCPQGHAKSLLDAVKTYAFASVLEGFWPKPSGNQRPRRPQSLVHEFYFFVVFAILSFDLSSEASKMRYCRPLFVRTFKIAIL